MKCVRKECHVIIQRFDLNELNNFFLQNIQKRYIMSTNISVMIKATILMFFQRVGGWCEPIKQEIFPLLELSMKVEG